jgi:hypothetical protein
MKSRRAILTLAGMSLSTIGLVYFVHHQQTTERAQMRIAVTQDIARLAAADAAAADLSSSSSSSSQAKKS